MSNNSSRRYGARDLRVRVKTARGRKLGSTRWLERQLNDPYVAKAREQGYKSRAAFKLLEIQEKTDLIKRGDRIVDLGAAPGGWSQVAASITGSTNEDPHIVGIDYLEMEAINGVILLEKDFLDDDAPDALNKALNNQPVDLVMSDMAAPTTGHRKTDHLRTTHLFEVAAYFAEEVLQPGGSFLAKVFRGGAENDILANMKRKYETIKHIKPPASRPESPELYMLATGFRGND